MTFTDGGTDQRNNLELVKCASICIFNICTSWLDVHQPTAGAQRIMFLLNLGLQNVSLERPQASEAT